MGWYGPRKVTKELESMEAVKNLPDNKSYWPQIQESGSYINQKDLDGIQKYWAERGRELEEDIFGLYHGWDWWAKQFGKKRDKDLVDLEFDLSQIKRLLDMSEDKLQESRWNYGRVVQNPKLTKARLLGDVEAVAFNYLKHLAWPNTKSIKNLKEKKVALAIFALIKGEEIGFDCEKGNKEHKKKYFKECTQEVSGKLQGVTVKKVLKSTWQGTKYWVPEKGGNWGWHGHPGLSSQEEKELIKMDNIQETSLLYEKCEASATLWDYFSDGEKEIRREICDQIIRPWFGNNVADKRLCLMEIKDFSYYLRLNTYLQILEIPTWHHKNTFWTKCSNYGI